MYCTRLAENTGRKKIAQNWLSGHHRTTLSGCSQQMSTIEKNLLNSNIPSSWLHNGELRPTNGWDRFGSLRHPSKFQRVSFASCLRYCSDVTHRRPTKLCTMLGRLLGLYIIYTFSGAYIRVRSVVWAYGRGQTDRQTYTQTRVTTIHFASSTTHAKCNNLIWIAPEFQRLRRRTCAESANKKSAVAEMGDRGNNSIGCHSCA